MHQVLYNSDDVVAAHYDQPLNTIIVTWTFLGPHDYLRPCLEAQLECAREDNAKSVIIDTSNATGVLDQSDQEWFGTTLFPEMQKAGVKAIITVTPENAIPKMASKQWQSVGLQFGIDFIETGSLETAKELAQQYAPKT